MRVPLASALVLALVSFLSGCASSRTLPLEAIPDIDREALIYYLDNDLYRVRLGDESPEVVTAGVGDRGLFTQYVLAPGVSSSGRYVMAAKEGLGAIPGELRRQQRLFLVDAVEGEVVLGFDVDRVRTDYADDPFWLEWASEGDAFYVADRDTVKKRWPDGRAEVLAVAADLNAFSVAPDEQKVLLSHGDVVSLAIRGQALHEVVAIGSKALGLGRRFVRAMAWAADGRVAFAQGKKVYVYNLVGDTLEEFEADRSVFDVVWLGPATLLLVEGVQAQRGFGTQPPQFYRFIRFDLGTGERERLYGSNAQGPASVKPRLSPSGELLLFAEQRLTDGGRHRVKVLSLDGQHLRVVDQGIYPFWR